MKYRIFIVEDDETIANLLKKHLSSWGYDVFLAEDFFQYTAGICGERSSACSSGSETSIL